jgi:hypothetical protein
MGVIGYRAGLNVQRLPHHVYWLGLRRWGILRFRGTDGDYQQSLRLGYDRRDQSVRNDDGEPVGDAWEPTWDPHLPPPPDDLLEEATFELQAGEADYLVHRIATCAGDSLLFHLISQRALISEDAAFVWEHADPGQLPCVLRAHVEHARNFSESMHGAPLLYNLMLAEEKHRDDWVDHYRTSLASWWEILQSRRSAMLSWNRDGFWNTVRAAGGRVRSLTRQFVTLWWDLTFAANSIESLMARAGARELIVGRESQLKGARARIGNPRALELWSGAAGTAQIDYRWGRPVRMLLNDIQGPLVEGK